MAWVDDRLWCHDKFADLSKQARWSWVAAVCYSTGFHTKGVLTDGQLRLIGATARERKELIAAELWHSVPGGVVIHDWDEHNSKRDERRAADRARKRKQRDQAKTPDDVRTEHAEVPADIPRDIPRTSRRKSTVTARVEGSEGSDGSEGKAFVSVLKNGAVDVDAAPDEPLQPPFLSHEEARLAVAAQFAAKKGAAA